MLISIVPTSNRKENNMRRGGIKISNKKGIDAKKKENIKIDVCCYYYC